MHGRRDRILRGHRVFEQRVFEWRERTRVADRGRTCASVNDTIQSVSDNFEGVTAEQPEDAAAAFQAAADALGDASAEVGNAEVAALLPDIQAVFEAAGEAMTALSEGDATKVAELQNLGTDLQESFTTFQELCLE